MINTSVGKVQRPGTKSGGLLEIGASGRVPIIHLCHAMRQYQGRLTLNIKVNEVLSFLKIELRRYSFNPIPSHLSIHPYIHIHPMLPEDRVAVDGDNNDLLQVEESARIEALRNPINSPQKSKSKKIAILVDIPLLELFNKEFKVSPASTMEQLMAKVQKKKTLPAAIKWTATHVPRKSPMEATEVLVDDPTDLWGLGFRDQVIGGFFPFFVAERSVGLADTD